MNKELMELIEEISRKAGVSFSEACKIAVREINEYHREKNEAPAILGGSSSVSR
ncbi:hypothetical protein [Serratia fonticola]|uniref:hypothetical protein n=1 Tax=Serratia fonticola TaxID=47917 RepID=UPI003AACEC7B